MLGCRFVPDIWPLFQESLPPLWCISSGYRSFTSLWSPSAGLVPSSTSDTNFWMKSVESKVNRWGESKYYSWMLSSSLNVKLEITTEGLLLLLSKKIWKIIENLVERMQSWLIGRALKDQNQRHLTCLWLQVGLRVQRQSMCPCCRTNHNCEVKQCYRKHDVCALRWPDLDYSLTRPRTSLIYPQQPSITLWSIHYHHTQSRA